MAARGARSAPTIPRSRPKFTYERFPARSDEVAKDEGNDERVVELPRNWDEVGNEIERQRQVADEREQEQLATADE